MAKASIATIVSVAISLAAALILVPVLGGHPDGPGFWMSVVCPLVIAFPASTLQFHQTEKIRLARDDVASLHLALDGMHRDLTAAHAALQQKSRIDSLTGSLNRETFFGLLDAAATTRRPSALLIADADHFKHINDAFGHPCGDEALRAIAGAIGFCLRPQDFWGRIGGEEFAIFLDGADRETAHLVADMIRLAVMAVDLRADDQKVPLTVSIGGAWSPSGFNAETLFGEADRRLYRAKRAGRNRVEMEGDDTGDAPLQGTAA